MNKDTEMTTTRFKMDTGRVIDTQRRVQNDENMLLEAQADLEEEGNNDLLYGHQTRDEDMLTYDQQPQANLRQDHSTTNIVIVG